MHPYPRVYRSREVAAKIGTKNLYDATYNQLVPCVKPTTRWLYDADYVDALVDKLQKMYGEAYPVYDGYFARLFQLGYLYQEYRAHKSENSRPPSEIRERLRYLTSNGGAYPLTYLVKKLPAYSRQTISRWATMGKIVTVRVCGKWYLSGTHARRIIWATNECETVGDVAERLGISANLIYQAISDGRIPAFRDVVGHWRIDPVRVPSHSWTTRTTDVTLADAARRLGIPVTTIRTAMNRGDVRGNPKKRETPFRSIPLDEVQRWARQFTTLQPGFEWLQAQIDDSRRPPRTLSLEQTAKELGVGPTAIRRWCRAGLLPYFLCSFGGNRGPQRRDFVRLYIFGLKRFAGAEPLSRKQVEAYATACAAARIVV